MIEMVNLRTGRTYRAVSEADATSMEARGWIRARDPDTVTVPAPTPPTVAGFSFDADSAEES